MDPHVQKKIAPLINKIRDLALRRGEGAFRDVDLLLGLGRNAVVQRKGARGVAAKAATTEVKMSPEEFKMRISQFGIVLTTQECNLLLTAFRDAVGYLLVSDFAAHLKDTLNRNRVAIVEEAFASLAGSVDAQEVNVQSLFDRFDASQHPTVSAGKATPSDVYVLFKEVFDETKTKGGIVTKGEFVSYYAAVSCGISDDESFVEMLRALWHLYERVPTPPPVKCFIPSPSSPNRNPRFGATIGNEGDSAICPRTEEAAELDALPRPKRILGFTGHIPCMHEHFGDTFHKLERSVPALTQSKQPVVDDSEVQLLDVKTGNKSNKHSFSFA